MYECKTCLESGTNKIRFECRPDENSQIFYMMSVQGHSGGERMNPRQQNNVLIHYVWSDHIYFHVGSSHVYKSICDGGLMTGGLGCR